MEKGPRFALLSEAIFGGGIDHSGEKILGGGGINFPQPRPSAPAVGYILLILLGLPVLSVRGGPLT
jgi:hypothetical protein